MRKFTKEITLLMATVAVGAGLLMSCTNQPIAGNLVAPEETVCTETSEKTIHIAGSIVSTEADSATEIPPLAGDAVIDYDE